MPRNKSSKVKSGTLGTRLSNVVKPKNLSLQEWQILLRRNAAESEKLVLAADCDEHLGPCYRVMNPAMRTSHEVFFYGNGHPLNRCNCMDFKTSRLSTCKHLEAVRMSVASRRRGSMRPVKYREEMTLLYVDYSLGPCFALYFGTLSLKLKKLAAKVFDKNHRLSIDSPKLSALNDFISAARSCDECFEVTEDARELLAASLSSVSRHRRLNEIFNKGDAWLKDIFLPGIVPYQYQTDGIKFASLAGNCIIADEMGLGKTIQAIGAASLLNQLGYVSSVLVVCPTSLKYQWLREIQKFTAHRSIVVEGNPVQRNKAYMEDGYLFKIVSYNALSNDVKSSYSKLQFDMVIMDEVQRLKNWNTQAARGARKLQADYRVILTGTPLENKLEELYSIVQLVDQNILGPYYLFRNNHIVTDASGKVTGYTGLNSIAETLSSVLLRRRKVDVNLQLPGRMDKNLFVTMTRQQMDLHEEFRGAVARIVFKWKKYHFLSETDRRRLLLLLSQMRMVCDSTYILDQSSRYDSKVDEVLQIVSDVVAAGDDKLVIFSQWERMTRLIAASLDEAGVGYANLNGSVPSSHRKELIDKFTDNQDIRVFLSTDAGSTGLNLQSASYVINVDLPWNPAVLEQRIGRVYRIGQERKIQVINMVAPGTIEEQMLSKLDFKASMAEGVLDGGADDVSIGDSRIQQIVDDFDFSEPSDSCMSAEPDAPVEAHQSHTQYADLNYEIPDKDVDEIVDDSIKLQSATDTNDLCDKVIREGTSFIESLASVLSDSEQTLRLVEKLVQEDPDSGNLSIKLPIKGKNTLLRLLSKISAMVNLSEK